MKDRVLIVDDEASLRTLLVCMLQGEGYETETEDSITGLRSRFDGPAPDVILLDWCLPDGDGIEILPVLRARWPATQVIIITGMGTFEAAVEATRLGAFHFVGKPFQKGMLISLIRRACEFKHLQDRSVSQRQTISFLAGGNSPTFQSPRMREVLEQVEKLANVDEPVLISGENGAGKDVVAQLLHTLGSRVATPLRKLDCGTATLMTQGNFEWELFGSARTSAEGGADNPGGFLFEAGRGTAVFKDITSLSLEYQETLLEALSTGRFTPFGSANALEVRCRVLATTTLDPEAALQGGRLRVKLMPWIARHRIHVPPLRERRADIMPLANSFLQRFGSQARQCFKGFSPKAVACLESYDWPENIRQLENTIQSVCLTVNGGTVDEEHLPFNLRMEVAKKQVTALPSSLRLSRRN